MELSQFLTHPLFKKSIKTYGLGEILFRQGEAGKTMFIVLEGRVRLLSNANGKEYTIAIMGQGQFLGEKAIVAETEYPRHFTAQAMTPLTVLELGASELVEVQKQSPYLMKLILTRSFEMAEERLERANYLVRVLRSSNNQKRLIYLTQYLANTLGRKESDGIRIANIAEHIYCHIDMEKSEIESILNDFVAKGMMRKKTDTDYVIPSIDVLTAAIEMQDLNEAPRKTGTGD